LFGDVYPQINLAGASGPPIADNGVLKTKPIGHIATPQKWLECFSNIMEHKPCSLAAPTSATPSPTGKPEHK
jgi:hypothetical protein